MNSLDNVRVCFSGPFQATFETQRLDGVLEPDQVLIRTAYTLISPGTELALYTHTHVGFPDPANLFAKYPFYPGYSAVGEVEAVGGSVQDFSPGDTVFAWGRHQQYTVLSPKDAPLLHVPEGLSPQWAPFARMAQIANTGLVFSDASPGDSVAVIGLGLVGNLAAQLFQLRGADVIGMDLIDFRCELATQCGIQHVVNAERQEPLAAVHEATRGRGAHTVVEATGSPALIAPALEMATGKGEVILLGSPRGNAEIDVYNRIHRLGISLKGAHEALVPVSSDDAAQLNRTSVCREMLEYLDAGKLSVEPLITRLVSPHEIDGAYHALQSDKDTVLAILVDWSKL